MIDRRKKMVLNAPTLLRINQGAFKISGYKHHLSYGVWMFSAMSFVLVSLRAPTSIWVPMLAINALLGFIYWRWTYLSNQIRDAAIPDFILTEPKDLAWLAWARDLEPEIDTMLMHRRPDGHYTSRDLQQAYWRHAYYWADMPKRGPYYGDTDRCFEDLEKRREPQRLARAVGHRDVK